MVVLLYVMYHGVLSLVSSHTGDTREAAIREAQQYAKRYHYAEYKLRVLG